MASVLLPVDRSTSPEILRRTMAALAPAFGRFDANYTG